MRIPVDVARGLVRYAYLEPFRQTRLLQQNEFDSYLNERGVHLPDWVLDHFARQGIVHPLLVSNPERPNDGRFVPIDGLGCMLADRGVDAVRETIPPPRFPLPGKGFQPLADEIYWHPFQLWALYHVASSLQEPLTGISALNSAESLAKLTRRQRKLAQRYVLEWTRSSKYEEFYRVLFVLVAVEPLLIDHVDNKIRVSLYPGEQSVQDYFEWKQGVDGGEILKEAGVSIQTLKD